MTEWEKIQWNQIAWRKRNDGIDFYQTPERCVEKLLEKIQFLWNILEPCSWAGAISKILEKKWYSIISQDIRTDDWVYWTKWINFLECNCVFDNIVTNPPYFIAKEIVQKSLDISKDKVCMFLKLSFLESIDRYKFFKDTPLKYVFVFSKRPQLYPEWIEKPKNWWTIAYARYIREKWYEWSPMIDWIR